MNYANVAQKGKLFCLRIFIIILLIVNVLPFPVLAEEGFLADLSPEKQEEMSLKNVKVSLSLRNIDIIEALKFVALKSGLNIVPTQRVQGRVTLTVDNVPVKDVFDIMLRSNSLAYDKKGSIYNVMTEQEYKLLYGKNFSDTRKVKVFRLKYAVPEQAFTLLDAVKSDIGRLLAETESGSVMLIDTPEKIAEAERALEALEQKTNMKVFNLKYARAKDIEDQLKVQLDLKKVGMIRADERTNQVIVQTLPDRMKNIEELIQSLDKKTKAVLIDTKIIKIKLSDALQTGIQWEGLFNLAKQYGMMYLGSYPFSNMVAGVTNPKFTSRTKVYDAAGEVGYYPFSGTTDLLDSSVKTSPGQNMHVGIVGKNADFDAVINYMQTLGKTKIMASPSISVVNNQEARIHIGERRAYVTTTTTTGTSTKTVSEEVTFVDVGIRLSVTPLINDDGYVVLKVKPEVSNIIGNIVSSSGNKVPIIDTNTAETTVLAKDGSTVIIGGLGRDETTSDSEQVPFLGNIPFIGALFRNRLETKEHVELVIMLTPIIFEGDRFIQTKEAEKLPVKPIKRFDVFKPEIGVREQGSAVSTGTFVPVDKELLQKGFKPYGLNQIQENPINDKPKQAFAPSVADELAVKGYKGYN